MNLLKKIILILVIIAAAAGGWYEFYWRAPLPMRPEKSSRPSSIKTCRNSKSGWIWTKSIPMP